MKYWERWIGDWKRKTAHLSAEAKGIYGELLDHAYANETPLPLEAEEVYRIAGARTQSECKAVDRILREFFDRTESGYTNSRVTEEVARRRQYVEAQAQRAHMRWHKQPQEKPKRASGNGQTSFVPPAWLDTVKFSEWWKIRPARARTPAARLEVLANLEKMRSRGIDPNAVVANSLANGWQGLFEPKGGRGNATLRERGEHAAAALRDTLERRDGKG